MRSALMITLLASVLGPATAAAQMPGAMPGRRLVRIGFGGGVSVPTSNAKAALENGINGQAFLLIDTGILPPFRLNLGYQKFDFREAITGAAAGQTSILSGVGGMTVDLFRIGPLRPYVTAGLGAFSITDAIESLGTPTAEVSTQTLGSTTTTRFGIDGGAGLALKLGRLEGFIEARLQNVYTEAGAIDTRSIRSVPVTFGILF
jgi:hypothetical protein